MARGHPGTLDGNPGHTLVMYNVKNRYTAHGMGEHLAVTMHRYCSNDDVGYKMARTVYLAMYSFMKHTQKCFLIRI